MSEWHWEGPSWARNLKRSVGIPCAHRCIGTPGRLAISWHCLGMELNGRASAAGRNGNWKLEFIFDSYTFITLLLLPNFS